MTDKTVNKNREYVICTIILILHMYLENYT